MNSFNCTQSMDKTFSYYYKESVTHLNTWGKWGIDFFETGFNIIIQELVANWKVQQRPERQKKIDVIWKHIQNDHIQENDTLCKRIKKLAFVTFISLPSALVIHDFIHYAHASRIPSQLSFSACSSYIFKHHFYCHIVNILIDYMAANLEKRDENLHSKELSSKKPCSRIKRRSGKRLPVHHTSRWKAFHKKSIYQK